MISDLKLGFRMLRYGHGVKSNLIVGILIMFVGLALHILSLASHSVRIPGGIFLLVSAIFPIQIVYSLSMSNLIQASPAKRRMQTSVPAVMSGCLMLMMYLLHLLTVAVMGAAAPQMLQRFCTLTLELAFFAAFLMLYLSVCYKYFWVSVVMYCVMYYCMAFAFGKSEVVFSVFRGDWISLLLSALIGTVMIVAGCLLQYGISCLLYKVPMSKMAQAASLRKTL